MKLILSLFFITGILFSKDNTSYFLSGGLNYNIHSANFTNLPNVSNYSYSEYGLNSNITYNLGLGLNYKFNENMFKIFNEYSLSLNYNSFSILLNRQELLGNFIKENEYYPIYSEVPLDVQLGAISLKNNFWFDLGLPIDVSLIIGANYIVSNEFTQKEKAIDNNQEYTFENGLDTREEYNGKIENINSILLNVGSEVRYNYQLNENISLNPTVSFNQYFPTLVKDINWGLSSIMFNLALTYRPIEKIEVVKPIEPKPIIPEKPKEIVLHYYIDAYHNKSKLEKNQIVDIKYNTHVEKEQYSILPIIYFEKNSNNILSNKTSGLFELAINSLVDNIVNEIKQKDIKKVYLKTGKFIDEDKVLFEQRIQSIISIFEEKGINPDIFEIEYNLVSNLNFRYQELASEEDKIIISFDKQKLNLINFTYFEKESLSYAQNNEFKFKINYNLNEDIVNNLYFNINNINNSRECELTLSENQNFSEFTNQITLYSNPLSIKSNNLSDSFNVKLNYILNEKTEVLNKLENESIRFILGYFDFDSYEFAAIDREVLNFVKQALNENASIKIIPMTDNIGSESYNQELAKKRANTAINLLNIDKNKINIDLSNNHFFSNEHPYGRTLNRSVIIEIYK